MTKEKACNKCKKVKPASDFYPMSHGKLGLKGHCKQCEKVYRNNRKKGQIPKEGEPYKVNKSTLNHYFYLHFGFVDKRVEMSENMQRSKYMSNTYNIEKKDAK